MKSADLTEEIASLRRKALLLQFLGLIISLALAFYAASFSSSHPNLALFGVLASAVPFVLIRLIFIRPKCPSCGTYLTVQGKIKHTPGTLHKVSCNSCGALFGKYWGA
jgi:ribosomal protein S27E